MARGRLADRAAKLRPAACRASCEHSARRKSACWRRRSSTLEELYLLRESHAAWAADNIDHRLRQRDFRDQASDPVRAALGCRIAELESAAGVLVVGSNLRKEVPLLAHRVRKAAVAARQRSRSSIPRRSSFCSRSRRA